MFVLESAIFISKPIHSARKLLFILPEIEIPVYVSLAVALSVVFKFMVIAL